MARNPVLYKLSAPCSLLKNKEECTLPGMYKPEVQPPPPTPGRDFRRWKKWGDFRRCPSPKVARYNYHDTRQISPPSPKEKILRGLNMCWEIEMHLKEFNIHTVDKEVSVSVM